MFASPKPTGHQADLDGEKLSRARVGVLTKNTHRGTALEHWFSLMGEEEEKGVFMPLGRRPGPLGKVCVQLAWTEVLEDDSSAYPGAVRVGGTL